MNGFRRVVHELRDSRGVSLAEVLVAAALLGITITAVSSSLVYGLGGVEASRGSSTAVFLAEQRLEQIRAYAVSTASTQGFGNLNAAAYPAEAYGSINGYANYRRTVTLTPGPGGNADLILVQVTVFYRQSTIKSFGTEASTSLSSVVSRR